MNLKLTKRIIIVGLILTLSGDLGLGVFASIFGSILFLTGILNLARIFKHAEIAPAFFMPVALQIVLAILGQVVAGKSLPFLVKIYEGLTQQELKNIEGWVSWFVPSLILMAVLSIAIFGFFSRAYRILAESSNIKTFSTVAKLYKWAAFLFILLVGAVLSIVAQVVAIMGFARIKEEGL
ncbi:DUF996 domain-containing protein [Pseudothermotoga thermarum]|uniref:DUF996 domain-containing protein n=1 Tax=Pseudothermotoga thermarum DSM 5069 TaxID=688269 RepID=F7YUK6_9THEM|nr:DUF996 domain-containing protein [Pseudothermotoga thermarum]AEH51479.1 hypothetical protein Theth_1420 [Pseudothermotoga thermarum DSM 5069]